MTGMLQTLTDAGWRLPALIAAIIVAGLPVLLVAVAACVALFHPDAGRRKDARAVLTTLVPRRRR